MLCGNIKEMNAYMNDVATFTVLTGSHPSGRTQPERFYHVLSRIIGKLINMVRSNRESGYVNDIMCICLEFKVYKQEVEDCAVCIIADHYDTELMNFKIKDQTLWICL